MNEFQAAAEQSRLPRGFKINGSTVVFNSDRFEVPGLGDFTSAAANTTTLALTSGLTHSIVLVALR